MQMISDNVLFCPMGITSPLGYLPSLKSGRDMKYTGHCVLLYPRVYQYGYLYSVYTPGKHWIAYLSPSNLPDASDRCDQTVTYIEQAMCRNSETFY